MIIPHATWKLDLFLPYDRVEESWRLRDATPVELEALLLEILRGVRTVRVEKADDKRALVIHLGAQTG